MVQADGDARNGGAGAGADDGGGAGDVRATPVEVMRSAVEQLQALLGRAPESVSAVRPSDDGWEADVEVVEVARVPDTTSVLASYRVTLDDGGGLLSYERTRRYTRAQTESRG
ncbi:gas vesicle protein [Streptomyces sp. NPDC058001]|uniref:gas vesicle protein GvpO n=1 Tax=Streptomyces sp. NPDC058001 TaxID=3346300 RepID=UPI0036E1EC47